MLDLSKLEKEIDSFIANETSESYADLFKKTALAEFIEQVILSGGYTDKFKCVEGIVATKPNIIDGENDFSSSNNLPMAA